MIYYFAYGSNLHPLRLKERVPSAKLLGVTTYPKHQLLFHKKGIDGSAKCNILLSSSMVDLVYGAIYTLRSEDKTLLDRFEGKGAGYIDKSITLSLDGCDYSCFTYFAQQSYIVNDVMPYDWYKMLVLLGAEYLEFPSSYISRVNSVQTMEDKNLERTKDNQALIQRIIQYS